MLRGARMTGLVTLRGSLLEVSADWHWGLARHEG